jgi:hypothetical protein
VKTTDAVAGVAAPIAAPSPSCATPHTGVLNGSAPVDDIDCVETVPFAFVLSL